MADLGAPPKGFVEWHSQHAPLEHFEYGELVWRAATAAAHEADAKLAEAHLSTRDDTVFADEVGIEDNMTRTIATAIRSRAEEEK